MTRKNYIETVDKYLSGELAGDTLEKFNTELAFNQDLAQEVRLQTEIGQAVSETGIMNLRASLQNIAKQLQEEENDLMMEVNLQEQAFSFELSEELSSFKEFTQPVSAKDITGFSQSLPKIHLAQHNIAAKENIHLFYKEQQGQASQSGSGYELSPADEAIFEDIQAALAEKDIQDLRANLRQVAANLPAHQRTGQEIEQYNHLELSAQEMEDFEQEMLLNKGLAKDVELFREIDLAAAENDIMALRENLQAAYRTETSSLQRAEEIDQYLDGELAGNSLAAFEDELFNSPALAAEIGLYTEIDSAVKESDVMELREKLGAIGRQVAKQERQKRSFAAKAGSPRVVIATIAASLILILGIAGLVSKNHAPAGGDLYSQYYSPYQAAGIFRSGDALVDSKLTKALAKFNEKDYNTAIGLFAEVLEVDKNNPVGNFYSGMAYQETGKTALALGAYQNVVSDRDNLFVEQAQWYIGLCYLQTDNRKKAYQQFKKIATSEGFYQQKASAILRKIEYLE